MVDLGKADPADVSLSPERVADPAADAAAAFAAALRGKGVTVTAVRPGRAPVTATEVAGVDSPPVSALVARMLDVSSNDIAETLARQIAVHQGEPGTAAAGVAAVRASITRLGLPGADDRMVDAAGLARQNLVTTRLLAGTVATAAHGGTAGADASAKPSAGRRGTPDPDAADVDLSALVPGLPVAAFTGTLALRFTGPAAAGAGVVRGKTGTLSGITSMVGTVTTREGRLLAFSFVADAVPIGFAETNDARAALDRAAAVLAGCGCR
jgi:D-alanyl-D-alanine carboxypeptidase/D-alanyl-D-alanine-endopeptidase (penicillin-binding protein 4)